MNETGLRNRAWLLGIVFLANRAGLRPVSKKHLHSLVFLANSLAPIYDDEGVATRVIKYTQGPFYPDVQWDLDRLVGQSLAAISNVRISNESGAWWMDADYEITESGEALFLECRATLPLLARSYRFLVEISNAFASLTRDAQHTAPLEDAIYSVPGKPKWSALVFESPEDNYSALTASSFDQIVGEDVHLAPKERLQLYFGYLQRATELKQGAPA
jgi:hypothetical protein